MDLAPALNADAVDVEVVASPPIITTDLEAVRGPEREKCSQTPSPAARTSVLCAVWHKDPDRHRLLRGHQACLDAQSIPVERIYVFDAGDTPPDWLNGKTVVSREPLTIYEAWNLALPQIHTPYVINLNLDDRLNPDAVALYERVLDGGADLVGGDWRICFSQEETDAVEPAAEASTLPFYPEWPPLSGRTVRLGSGTGERGTLGPACAWRMALHIEFPKYPWQFKDGSSIRVIGDSVWWRLLIANGKSLKRLPYIVGRYYSHPGDQAEFRNPAEAEESKFAKLGIPPF
jgi:hypothetical protein